jgi:hypothetical protein
MSRPAEGPLPPDEVRRRIAWQRLIEASLRHGWEIKQKQRGQEDENATHSVTAGQVAFDSEEGNERPEPTSTR